MTVQTWTGSHKQNTETFKITSHDWRVRWQITPDAGTDPSFVIFSGAVYKESGGIFETFRGSEVNTILSSRLRGAGGYYLELSVANGAYAVTVEELR